ncbi:MAG: hypothetical protein NTW50_00890 [Candidatus Berkelbacteria bacterium]|nr:hypothetical protein [Candidatus Berkelbacteria bacterium]
MSNEEIFVYLRNFGELRENQLVNATSWLIKDIVRAKISLEEIHRVIGLCNGKICFFLILTLVQEDSELKKACHEKQNNKLAGEIVANAVMTAVYAPGYNRAFCEKVRSYFQGDRLLETNLENVMRTIFNLKRQHSISPRAEMLLRSILEILRQRRDTKMN